MFTWHCSGGLACLRCQTSRKPEITFPHKFHGYKPWVPDIHHIHSILRNILNTNVNKVNWFVLTFRKVCVGSNSNNNTLWVHRDSTTWKIQANFNVLSEGLSSLTACIFQVYCWCYQDLLRLLSMPFSAYRMWFAKIYSGKGSCSTKSYWTTAEIKQYNSAIW
jgi:hypothetical protein